MKTYVLSLVEEVEKAPGRIVIRARIAWYTTHYSAEIDYPRVAWAICWVGNDATDGWARNGLRDAQRDPDVLLVDEVDLDRAFDVGGLAEVEAWKLRVGIVDLTRREDTLRLFCDRITPEITGSEVKIDLDRNRGLTGGGR